MMPITMSSDTSSPRSMIALALRPVSVPGSDGRPQHVAGRELLHAVTLLEELGLGALAGARRPEKNDVHRLLPLSLDFLIRPSYCWASRCPWTWATVSMVTLTTISSDVPPK